MITFQIQDSSQPSGWFDITKYWAFESLQEDENDVDGTNAGRVIGNGVMIRDKLGEKEKFFFKSIPMDISIAWHIKALVRREYFYVRTDLKDGVVRTYEVYCGARTNNYMRNRKDGSQLVRLSFNMIER